MKRVIIIGGTSTIAEHCAELWMKSTSIDLILVGRNYQKLEAVAHRLRLISPASTIVSKTTNFEEPEAIATFVQNESYKPIDLVLIAHGSKPNQNECEENLVLCSSALVINGLSTALFAEAFAHHMQKYDSGTLAVIGSIAGDRGRRSNYIYGSSKGMVERYVEGLQHRFFRSKIRVILVKPGPTRTPMTSQKSGRLADPRDVARTIVKGIGAGSSVVYAPKKWQFIMMVVSSLPRIIYNKLNI